MYIISEPDMLRILTKETKMLTIKETKYFPETTLHKIQFNWENEIAIGMEIVGKEKVKAGYLDCLFSRYIPTRLRLVVSGKDINTQRRVKLWARVKNGKLPEYFSDGWGDITSIEVPDSFHKELKGSIIQP
jgi:hypothetical protein